MDEGRIAANIAIALLPSDLVKNLCSRDHKIGIVFWANNEYWAGALVTKEGDIFINLTPKRDIPELQTLNEWPLRSEEITSAYVFTVLHEIGHLYGRIKHYYVFEKLYNGDNLRVDSEQVPTRYVKARASKREDFAESFALYVLWPEYLKQNFPQRYVEIRKLVKTEFPSSDFKMPGYLKDQLTVR